MGLRVAAVLVIAIASLVGLVALDLALVARPMQGVSLSADGLSVATVDVGGRAWSEGIRPGDVVTTSDPGQDIVEWRLVARGADGDHSLRYSVLLSSLRGSLLQVTLAAVLLTLGALVLRRPLVAGGLAVAALLLASVPWVLSGGSEATAAGILAGVLVPGLWLLVAAPWPRPVRWGAAAGALAVALAWAYSRWREPALYDAVDTVRLAGVGVLVIGAGLAAAGWPDVRAGQRSGPSAARGGSRLITVRPRDVAVATGLLVVVVLAVAVWHLALPVVPLIVLAAVALYPPWRRAALGAADRLLLGDVREQAAIAAIEEERARVSRDLHDAPLQELAAVIRRLERAPNTEPEAEALRVVADHLRRVVSDLRPPMLDDLGLAAALGYLVDRATEGRVVGGPRIELAVEGSGSRMDGERPPADVELAAFRTGQEAISNALTHAGAALIRLSARVERDAVTVSILDDGAGLDPERLMSAERAGRFGIASLRQRAAAVGATLSVESVSPRGTRVTFTWRAER